MNFSKHDKIEIFENSISWIVVFAMFLYGLSKPIQLEVATEIKKNTSELTGMELMWAFYGYSKSFAITLGLFEITGGILILIKRTRVIGCILTSTILVNVILQDVFYEVNFGALKAALIYQLLILVILWLNREKVMRSIRVLLERRKIKQSKTKLFVKLLLAFVIFAGLRVLEYFITAA